MIMSKESYEAWMRMQHFVYETNLNIEHQIGWEDKEDNILMRLDVFDRIVDDLCSQINGKVKA